MKKIIYSLFAVCAMLGFTACGDDDDWTAGDPDSPDSPGVFFADDNSFAFQFESGLETPAMSIHLKRLNAENAVTVPLTSTVDDEHIKVPESVEFAAGQTDAYIIVNATGIPERTTFNMEISVPEAYRTLYGQGSDVYNGTVVIVSWIEIDTNFKYRYCDGNNQTLYTAGYGTLSFLAGTNKYKLSNFMGSGMDFMFELDSTQSGCSTTFIGINPLTNYLATGNDYDCWYLYDTDKGDYPSWSIDDKQIKYFYAYGVGYSYLHFMDVTDPDDYDYGCFSGYFCEYSDTESDGEYWVWTYVWCYFDVPDDIRDQLSYKK
jgi:hypothetical protein